MATNVFDGANESEINKMLEIAGLPSMGNVFFMTAVRVKDLIDL